MVGASVTPAIDHGALDRASEGGVSPADLAELISAFNDVTTNLSATHTSLRSEVTRLEGELREARGQLARAQQLAALGEMAAGIAHEVRNPLGSIQLYASILREDLGDRPEQQGVAVKIANAVAGLDAVVSDVLAFSKTIDPQIESVDASDLIDRASCACADVIERGGVRVRVTIEDGLRVDCDPCMMNLALVNVLRNACEAMADTGGGEELEVVAKSTRALDAEGRRGEMASIAITDRGPGISQEVLERAFNPFFTTRHTGTGLGLAIVHRIVDAHMGRVVMRNNKDIPGDQGGVPRGLTVEFLIPRHTATTQDATEARGS